MEKPRRIPDIIIRTSEGPFMLLPRNMIYDPNLSPRAKGVIGMILAKPECYSMTALRKRTRSGEDIIRRGLRELCERGYLKTTKLNAENITYLKTVLGIEKGEKPNEENQ